MADCRFPAAGLREYQADLQAKLRALVVCDETPRVLMNSLLWIERLAADHEDIAGCRCWHEGKEAS